MLSKSTASKSDEKQHRFFDTQILYVERIQQSVIHTHTSNEADPDIKILKQSEIRSEERRRYTATHMNRYWDSGDNNIVCKHEVFENKALLPS